MHPSRDSQPQLYPVSQLLPLQRNDESNEHEDEQRKKKEEEEEEEE